MTPEIATYRSGDGGHSERGSPDPRERNVEDWWFRAFGGWLQLGSVREETAAWRTQLHQVLQNFKSNGQGAVSSWPRSMAIALLAYTMLLQLGVMEVQAHHQAGIIERHIHWKFW
ncbi:hypothetical protein M758_3G177200 [Ceratodon purpureus]|nr:hypothetical protein M758_3G177200 [Ceratodon purpureus]